MKNIFILSYILLLSISAFSQSTLIPYRKAQLWGFADTSGKIIIDPTYDYISTFLDEKGNYIVSKNEKRGRLSPTGKTVIPVLYEDISRDRKNPGYITKVNNKYGYITSNGDELIQNNYRYIYSDTGSLHLYKGNNIFTFNLTTNKITDTIIQNDTDEIIRMDMNIDSQNELDTILRISYYSFKKGKKRGFYIRYKTVEKDGYYEKTIDYYNDTINKLFDNIYIVNLYNIDFVLVQKKNRWGVYLKDQNIIPIKYDSISTEVLTHKCEDFFLLVKKKEKWGIMDLDGKFILTPEYDAITLNSLVKVNSCTNFFIENGISVVKDGKHGIVKTNGKILIPFSYDNIIYQQYKGWYEFYSEDKKGIYSPEICTNLIFNSSESIDRYTIINGFSVFLVFDADSNELGLISLSGTRFFED